MTIHKLLEMLHDFLTYRYDPWKFSFDFPDAYFAVYDVLEKRNPEMRKSLDDLVNDCAYLDPHATGDPDLLTTEEYMAKAWPIYRKIQQLLAA